MAPDSSLRKLLAARVRAGRLAEPDLELRDGVFRDLADRPTIRFATTGRRTGLRREKWWVPFIADGDTIYLIEEVPEQAHWVKNVTADPRVEVGAEAGPWRPARARRVVDDEELERARAFMTAKFGGGEWAFISDGGVFAFDA